MIFYEEIKTMFTVSEILSTNCTAFHYNRKRKLFAKVKGLSGEVAGNMLTKTEQLWNNQATE